jgi:hypothetical protein
MEHVARLNDARGVLCMVTRAPCSCDSATISGLLSVVGLGCDRLLCRARGRGISEYHPATANRLELEVAAPRTEVRWKQIRG